MADMDCISFGMGIFAVKFCVMGCLLQESCKMERVEITVTVKAKTEKAMLVNDGGKKDVWVPLSQIQTENEIEIGNVIEIDIPEWLAKDKGFI